MVKVETSTLQRHQDLYALIPDAPSSFMYIGLNVRSNGVSLHMVGTECTVGIITKMKPTYDALSKIYSQKKIWNWQLIAYNVINHPLLSMNY